MTLFYKVENYEFITEETDPLNEVPYDLYKYMDEDIEYITVKEKDMDRALNSNEYTSFNPLEDTPNLYTDIAKIGKDDKKGLMNFVKEYGLPTGEAIMTSNPYHVFITKEEISEIFPEIEEYKRALNVYQTIRNGDQEEIQKLVQEFRFFIKEKVRESQFDIFYHQNEKANSGPESQFEVVPLAKSLAEMEKINFQPSKAAFNAWEKIKDRDPKDIAMAYLTELLNEHGQGNSSYALINGKIEPGTTFKNLLEVAYFQLSRAVIGNITLRPCEHCGALFEVTHESRRFCPPHKDNKISTCQNSYNQRIKRKRKKARELHKEGMSLSEIVSKIKMPANEVKQWLE